jgi:anti-anti-sigma regulatory factor
MESALDLTGYWCPNKGCKDYEKKGRGNIISSSGLRVLLATLKILTEKSGKMRLASLQHLIRNILDISGLSNIFSIHHSLKEAMESFD